MITVEQAIEIAKKNDKYNMRIEGCNDYGSFYAFRIVPAETPIGEAVGGVGPYCVDKTTGEFSIPYFADLLTLDAKKIDISDLI